MRKLSIYLLTTIALLALTFSACVKNKTTKTFTITLPIFKSKQEVYNDIKTHAPTPITTAGKIFIKGNYIFLSEKNKGVHIINNTNPSLPINESFIPIPGTEDAVVKGDILLVDCYADLLSIDISQTTNARLVNTAANVFPERRYINGYDLETQGVIVGWVTKDTTTTVEYYNSLVYNFDQGNSGPAVLTSGPGGPTTGVGGSMARFTLVNNYLYTVSNSTLRVFDVQNAVNPNYLNNVSLGWNIETIYPVKDKLFIGSQTGMFVYSISNPTLPTQLCTFTHANQCDPVIADDNYAYITLRSGNTCMGIVNEMLVVDITNITAPVLTKTYQLSNPHGLSKDGDLLFVCDGSSGLRIYDANDVSSMQDVKTIQMPTTYDVIAYNKTAFVSAEDGIYQYNYTDKNNVQLISKITFQ